MSRITPIHRGIIQNGKIKIFDRDRFRTWLNKFEDETRIEVIVKKEDKSRSTQQNRYYWGVVLRVIGDELGYDPEELHDLFKSMSLKKHIDFEGKRYEIVRSTTSLTTDEMAEYIDKIIRWASEQGIEVPEAENARLD